MAKSAPKKNMREEILTLAVQLFAKAGFDGVSMRDIATAAGVTTAALYHHFSDKEDLYLSAVDWVFKEKTAILKTALSRGESPWVRLESFILAFSKLLSQEKDFRRLLQWVQLDTDEQRTQKLTDNVFLDVLTAVYDLAGELDQSLDAHLLTVSIMSLIMMPFEAEQACRFLPGYRPRHEDPAVLAAHIIGLLRTGLLGKVDVDRHPGATARAGKRATKLEIKDHALTTS